MTFFQGLFSGAAIIPRGNVNYSLVGLTPAVARKVGVTGSVKEVPSVDRDIERCGGLAGRRRVTCWMALDRKLMTDIVPWVPTLSNSVIHVVGPKVSSWQFDQSSAATGYAHVAVR